MTDTDEIAARLREQLRGTRMTASVRVGQDDLTALLDERERQAEHIAAQAQDIMTLSAELARLRAPAGEVGEAVKRLNGWADDLSIGRKCFGADQDVRAAADLITRQAARIKELEVAADEVDCFWLKDVTRADKAEASLREAVEVIGWIDAWVSNPVGSYSVSALSGLFSVTRERINAFIAKMEKTDD